MKNKNELKNIKATNLVSIIVHGANLFGKKMANTLLEQGSKVIIIDYFTKETKPFVQDLKKNKNVDFIAFEGLENLLNTIGRFDYLFYLQFMMFKEDAVFTSKEFLEESSNLDKCIKASVKNNVKMSIVTSLEKNKSLVELTQLEDGKPKPYSDLEIQRYSETITAEQYDKSNLNVRIIRIGALLGQDFHGFGDNTVSELFNESISKESLTIKGEGLENHYYINCEDALFSILRLTFDHQTNGEVISLANDKPLTTLSLAYKLLELNTEARRIEFVDDDNEILYKGHYVPAPFASKYGIKPKFTIEETFIQALDSLYKNSSKKWDIKKDNLLNTRLDKLKGSSVLSVKTPLGEFIDKIFEPFRKIFKKGDGSKNIFNLKSIAVFLSVLTLFLLLSFGLLTPIANIAYGAYKANNVLDSAYKSAIEFDLEKAGQYFEEIDPYIERIEFGTERLSWLFSMIGQEDLYNNLLQMISASKYAVEGANQMSYSLQPLAEYFKEFEPAVSLGEETPGTTREYREYLEELRSRRFQLTKATDNLYLASLQIDSIDTTAFPKKIEPYVSTLKQYNDQLLDKINPFKETVFFLPEMLGVDERQRYLVLFQNPGEIRSTGGWISSYAIIGLEGGQLRQLDVDDVYNLDGLLKVQGKVIQPPEDMMNALNLPVWTLSTSNWNPDFSESANDASYFVKEAGKLTDVDGVLAMDTEFLKLILDIWGSVNIQMDGEVTEEVTSENLQENIFNMHTDFEPGSTQKSEFISLVFNELLTITLQDKSKYPALLSAIYDSLESKHFLVTLKNSDANRFFSTQGWDGAITSKYRSAPIPIEWNWGGNKANIYLEETTTLQVRILDESTIQYTYTLSTKNNSTSDTYPEGEYINYFRVFLPESALIDEIQGFQGTTSTYLYNGSKVVAGWFNTAVSGTNQLTLKYTINDQSDDFPLSVTDSKFNLDLNIFKQPGLYPGVYKIEIIYPDTWAVTTDNDLNRDINKLSGQFDQEKNMSYELVWEYKNSSNTEENEDAQEVTDDGSETEEETSESNSTEDITDE